MSRDRVGIIHDVASRIAALQGNIADLSQTVVSGYFTMILLADFPETLDAGSIKANLSELNQSAGRDTLPIEIAVMPVPDPFTRQQTVPAQNKYILTASGEDRIGFVAMVASFCAENLINILDLSTLVNDGQYMMILQVDLSRCASLKAVQRKQILFSQKSGIKMVLQHNDIFEAMHEINMPN